MMKHGAAQDIWIGIDLGTQSVRAVAETNGGDIIGSGAYLQAKPRRDLTTPARPSRL